jgi:hypothetical protein
MKKRLIGLLLTLTCFFCISSVAYGKELDNDSGIPHLATKHIENDSINTSLYAKNTKNDKVIPYPAGYSTTSGAAYYLGNVNIKNSPYYTVLDFYNKKSSKTLTLLSKFKTYQQTTETSCGPASALMVLYHFGNQNYEELQLADIMNTNKDMNGSNTTNPGEADEQGEIGTPTDRMVNFFESIGWNVRSSITEGNKDGKTFEHPEEMRDFIIQQLKNNTPIMVENVDWGGHWRVIIGYDTMGTNLISDDVIIMADPYDTTDQMQDGYTVNSAERFFYMWVDNDLLPVTQKYQQWLLATPPKTK